MMEKKKRNRTRKQVTEIRGITLIALVVTIVVLLILAGISISLLFSQNGVIKKAREAAEKTQIAQVTEKLELAKTAVYMNEDFKFDLDDYFQSLEDEGIIGDKDTDIVDNGDGTYEITTDDGYIFEITVVPNKDNPEGVDIEYSGKVDGPRIRKINVTNKTTSSISLEVETGNAEGATYTYYYKKDSESEWIKVEENKENTYTFSGLEANVIYNIKVVVEKDGKTAEKEISTITGELPEGAVQFSTVTWSNGQASTVITTTETGYTLQYQIGGIEENNWTNITSGTRIENLQHGTTVYGRLFDGTNGSKNASIDIKDEINPTIVVTEGTITTNSISVNVQATDNESEMTDTPTYTYYIKKNGEADSSYTSPTGATGITQNTYTFTGLTQGTSYDVKVEVNGDKAGNTGTGTLTNQTTGTIGEATEGLVEGNIVATNPTWSNGKASITLSTSTGLTIQYQVNGIDDEKWTTGTRVTGLNHNDTVYARLTDGTNYGEEASVDIIDNIAPSAPIIKATQNINGENGWYKTNVEISITAGNDNGKVDRTTYIVSGAQTSGETTGTSLNITQEGTSTITAYTYDSAGNRSSAATLQIKKDSIAPTISGLVNTTVTSYNSSTFTSGVTVSDSTSGVNGNFTYSPSTLKDGSNTITYTAKDNAGNIRTATRTITYNGTAYLVDKVAIGDYVAYDAGTWSNTVSKPTSNASFGGYTSGQNKGTSVGTYNNLKATTNGWRVLSKSGSGASGTVTLIAAGCPATGYYIANSSSRQSAMLNGMSNFISSNFVNSAYASSARSVIQNDRETMQSAGVYDINSYYWFGEGFGSNLTVGGVNYIIPYYSPQGGISGTYASNVVQGIRPIVVLKAGVKTNGTKDTSFLGQTCWAVK